MLESKSMTPQETEKYLRELKEWLDAVKDNPAEEMANFFAKRVAGYDENHLTHWPEEYAHIAGYLDDGLHNLLDIGCGTGLELESIYRRFPDAAVTGIDLSGPMLQKLREKYPDKDIKLIEADYFVCPFPESCYDAALSFETLHHFKPEKKQKIYEKLYRALKPDGYYLECDYIACCDEEERLCMEGYEDRRQRNNIPEDVFVHIDIPLTLPHQRELLQNAGFRQVDVLYQNGSTMIIKAVK